MANNSKHAAADDDDVDVDGIDGGDGGDVGDDGDDNVGSDDVDVIVGDGGGV